MLGLVLQINCYHELTSVLKLEHKMLDNFFSVLSCVIFVPFYTGFLPLLFWSGHGRLARQMTLLMAFYDYLGNSVKVLPSACIQLKVHALV
ncbi:lipid phosphate phosphatase delta [Zea mays]|uniref:lipid phosphate phosphatase delta n=1 Tax=Zea mays TaxID=4577 RepID=UPI0009A989FE|nr:lipid phosphate phosphatase delta [Zea mays]|eukprot:XP_020397930.1 lipid phosphate phosphatase delta [Zea mays]